MTPYDYLIRPARKTDAPALAKLINIAGEGIPLWLWRQSAGNDEDAMSLGAQRAARETGGFSYRNAHVAEANGEVQAMLLGYRLAEPSGTDEPDELPAVVRPLVELESLAPGSWYVNAIATLDQARGRGLGTQLLALAHTLARESGAAVLSLIVASENRGAFRLYQRQGYETVSRRPVVPFPGCHFAGDWVLMTRPVSH
jgi:ribosomal protein S18 acetylase RimI-like enzyme